MDAAATQAAQQADAAADEVQAAESEAASTAAQAAQAAQDPDATEEAGRADGGQAGRPPSAASEDAPCDRALRERIKGAVKLIQEILEMLKTRRVDEEGKKRGRGSGKDSGGCGGRAVGVRILL
jgi:hypothetical protein